LGKNVRKPQGVIFFDSHCTLYVVSAEPVVHAAPERASSIIQRHMCRTPLLRLAVELLYNKLSNLL